MRGMHLQIAPGRRGQARALHPRRDRRLLRRPARGQPDLRQARHGRADRGQPARAVDPAVLRPRLPDAHRRHRGRSTRSAACTRPAPSAACATTTPLSAWPGPSRSPSSPTRTGPGRTSATGSRSACSSPTEAPVILVDKALAPRGRGHADPRRHRRPRASWPRGFVNQVTNSGPRDGRRRRLQPHPGQGRAALQLARRRPRARVRSMPPRPASTAVAAAASTARHRATTRRSAQADGIDVVVDGTGAVEHGAHVVAAPCEHGKHVVLHERRGRRHGRLDPATRRPRTPGVVFTGCDGDQPGVQMNLIRFVRGLGLTPLVAGNIKGLQDPYRNPTTQKGFAEQWGQDPLHGDRASPTARRSRSSRRSSPTPRAVRARSAGCLRRGPPRSRRRADRRCTTSTSSRALGGVVDYVVGCAARPGRVRPRDARRPQAAALPQPLQARRGTALQLLHALPPVPLRGARHRSPAPYCSATPRIKPLRRRRASRSSRSPSATSPAGETLDALGGYTTTASARRPTSPPPSGCCRWGSPRAASCCATSPKDEVITYADVRVPPGRLADELRAEQDRTFPQVALQGGGA